VPVILENDRRIQAAIAEMRAEHLPATRAAGSAIRKVVCEDCADYERRVLAWFTRHKHEEIVPPHPKWDDVSEGEDYETLRKRCYRHARKGHEVAKLHPRKLLLERGLI
jgi:hypothetical protein